MRLPDLLVSYRSYLDREAEVADLCYEKHRDPGEWLSRAIDSTKRALEKLGVGWEEFVTSDWSADDDNWQKKWWMA